MPVQTVGARLNVSGRARFVADMAAATDSLAAFNAEAAKSREMTLATVAGSKSSTAAKAEETAATDKNAEALGAQAAMMKKSGDAAKAADAEHKKFKSTLNDIANGPVGKIGMWGGAAILGGAYASIKTYMDYQSKMVQMVTQAQLPMKQLPGLLSGAEDISKRTGINLGDIANQMYRIKSGSVGLVHTNKQLLQMENTTANLAVLFQTTPGSATENLPRILTALMTAGSTHKLTGVGNYSHMAALLNATVGVGDIRGSDVLGALGRGVLQSGEIIHAKLPDILASIDLSSRLGANPIQSGTLLAHALQQVAVPSEQGTKAEAMIGVVPSQLQGILSGKGGLLGAINLITRSAAHGFTPNPDYPVFGTNAPGAASAQAQLIAWGQAMHLPGVQSTAAAAIAAGSGGPPMTAEQQRAFTTLILTKTFGGARQEIPIATIAENQKLYSIIERDILKGATKAALNRDINIALHTPHQQELESIAGIKVGAAKVGQNLYPIWLGILHDTSKMVNWFEQHQTITKDLAKALGGVILAALGLKGLNFALKGFEGLSKSVHLISNMAYKLTGGAVGKAAGASGLDGAAVALKESAAALDDAAVSLKGGIFGGKGGLTGSAATAEEGAIGGSILGSIKNGLVKGGLAGLGVWMIGNMVQGIAKMFPHNKVAQSISGMFDYAAHPMDILKHPMNARSPFTDWLVNKTLGTNQGANQGKFLTAIEKIAKSPAVDRLSEYRKVGGQVGLARTYGAISAQGAASLVQVLKAAEAHPLGPGSATNNSSANGALTKAAQSQQQGAQILKTAATGHQTAAKQLQQVAALQKTASSDTKSAAQQEQDASKSSGAAAKAHLAAAQALNGSALELSAAASSIASAGAAAGQAAAAAGAAVGAAAATVKIPRL